MWGREKGKGVTIKSGDCRYKWKYMTVVSFFQIQACLSIQRYKYNDKVGKKEIIIMV